MKSSLNEAFEDGFESDDEDKVDIMNYQQEDKRQNRIILSEQMIKYVPPPQEIKEKPYSLHPDISTGWAPKISLPKPVPLTFPHDPLAQALNAYFRAKPNRITLLYLGPRFDNTYSAWSVLGVQFPYSYLGNQAVTKTDRKFLGMNPELAKYEGLRFDSMFESGNLDAAFKVGAYEYDCFMRVDSNTRGHLQWYFFTVANLSKNNTYHLNICNFQKAKTLYNRGMKPYIFSYKDIQIKRQGWKQAGQDIQYTKRLSKAYQYLINNQDEDYCKYYTLSFSITTNHENDTIQIAYCPPYTFTKLNAYLKDTLLLHKERDIIISQHLCTSLGGFKIPLFTISNSVTEVEAEFKVGKPYKNRGLIFVMGRIHPGQANGSYMMEGFINELCSHSEEAEQLRNRYVFKIVPMMNPDGVVMGNYRAGLSGRDFNRQFIDPDRTWFVEIYQLKLYLQRSKWIYQGKFDFFLDFHGHTVKKNAFTYGPEFPLTNSKYYESRMFPKLLSKRTSLFRFYSCIFKISPCKSATARAVLLREYKIPFVYTIEASNGSYYDYDGKNDIFFSQDSWQHLGKKICESLFDYSTIAKQIEEVRMKRRKQKQQIKFKTKIALSRRIQSSSNSRATHVSPGRKSKPNLKIDSSEDLCKTSIFNQIFNELTADNLKQADEKWSDDQLSQGKSDSQNSQDDIDQNQIRSFLAGKQKIPTKKIKHSLSLQEQRLQQREVDTKRPSFITECEDNEPQGARRHPIFQRNKRYPFIRKKIYTTSGSPSPLKESQTGVATKIVNLSFLLNPVPISNPIPSTDKRARIKTDVADEYDGRQCLRTQYSQNSRRNYLSMQRQSIKRQLMKRLNSQSNAMSMTSHQPFRFQQIVGRRIFSDA